jgi:glycosyltransferase involved in cell wall biosynthesis
MQFPGRLALQQRVLPAYRAPFFELLAASCREGLSVYAGQPQPVEGITPARQLTVAHLHPGRNLNFRHPASPFYLCWQRGLLQWLQHENPQALIVEANPRYLSTPLAVRWMQRRGRPVWGWGLGVGRSTNALERILRLNFLRHLDGLLAYSRRGADEYRAIGLPRVRVASNAVSPRPTQPPPERIDSRAGTPTVLFVGRLQARKRLDILLNACRDLPPNIQPQVVIIGDGPAKAEFETQAAQIYPQARFVGAKHGGALVPYFTQADLFVLPGTGGLAVQQAMSYGLPVIVAQGDGTQDDLVRPENGWQVPPGDQDAFLQALALALSDRGRLRQMGRESYRIVSQEINLESMVAAFIEALMETLPAEV